MTDNRKQQYGRPAPTSIIYRRERTKCAVFHFFVYNAPQITALILLEISALYKSFTYLLTYLLIYLLTVAGDLVALLQRQQEIASVFVRRFR